MAVVADFIMMDFFQELFTEEDIGVMSDDVRHGTGSDVTLSCFENPDSTDGQDAESRHVDCHSYWKKWTMDVTKSVCYSFCFFLCAA